MKIIIASKIDPWSLVKQLSGRQIEATWAPVDNDLVESIKVAPMDAEALVLLIAPSPVYALGWIRGVRNRGSNCLIYVILPDSGYDGYSDRAEALIYGADEAQSSFVIDEVEVRIHALKRRSSGMMASIIQTGDLTVNLDAQTVQINGQNIRFTRCEYLMLELLCLRKGMTVTKEMFLNHLYQGMDEPALKIIDVFICKLRRKLGSASGGQSYIETVWGRGHVLREPQECAA